jgi:hypothetical protein
MSEAAAGSTAAGSAAAQMSVAKSLTDVLARVAAASTRAGRASPVRALRATRLRAPRPRGWSGARAASAGG